jgi:hypothetical protein
MRKIIKKTKMERSRRKFVQTASTGIAAFSIVPSFAVSGLGHVAPSDKLYIAAIGCGGEGENDIHHYANAPKKNAVVCFIWVFDDRIGAPRI